MHNVYLSFFLPPCQFIKLHWQQYLLRKFCAELCQQNHNPSSSYHKKRKKKKKGFQEGHEKQTIFGKRPDSCILFDNQGWWIEHKVVYFKAVHGVTSILANSKYWTMQKSCSDHVELEPRQVQWNSGYNWSISLPPKKVEYYMCRCKYIIEHY